MYGSFKFFGICVWNVILCFCCVKMLIVSRIGIMIFIVLIEGWKDYVDVDLWNSYVRNVWFDVFEEIFWVEWEYVEVLGVGCIWVVWVFFDSGEVWIVSCVMDVCVIFNFNSFF